MSKWTTANIPSQAGKVAIVTGANSGIGWHTALELARAQAMVVLTVRTEEKGREAIDRILAQVPGAKLRFEILDVANLSSIRAFAERIDAEPKIDILVNNAGVMAVPERRLTADGFEFQFGTNFLGPFALTGLLLPALLRAPAPRVTTISSGAAVMGLKRIKFEDLQWEHDYSAWTVYCQSKLADLLFARELGRRATAQGLNLVSNAAHPGYARTNLQTTGPGRPQNFMEKLIALVLSQDAAHGALPTLRAATEPNAGSGSYFGPDGIFQCKGNPIPIAIPKPGQDEAAAKKLWEESESLTGFPWPAGFSSTPAITS